MDPHPRSQWLHSARTSDREIVEERLNTGPCADCKKNRTSEDLVCFWLAPFRGPNVVAVKIGEFRQFFM